VESGSLSGGKPSDTSDAEGGWQGVTFFEKKVTKKTIGHAGFGAGTATLRCCESLFAFSSCENFVSAERK
jgi:hypothetical protein